MTKKRNKVKNKSTRDLGQWMVDTKKKYNQCELSEEGHKLVDASYTDWQGNYHSQNRCEKCGVYFPKE